VSVKPEKIQVQIKYKGVEQQFSADPQEAWLLLNQFFKNTVPSFEIAQQLWLNIDIAQLAKDLNGIVAFSRDGPTLLVPKHKLTDNETLLVWLAGYYLGHELGFVNCDSLSKEELQTKLGKSSKITSTRLGELVKSDFAAKTAEEKFRITAFGELQLKKEVLPKIKSKMGAKIF
jgi:DNA-directed RNA polymerase subunit H (RpoH/RPB5)